MIKCLIWDLDDTLWEGTLRENWNVILKEEKRALIKQLDQRGILQSIASRNDTDRVMKKLEELGLSSYFLYPQCNDGSKVQSIKNIVGALNIGMESVAYIDDNPFERFEVSYFLPMVHIYEAQEALRLPNINEFKVDKLTREAGMRRSMMLSRQSREQAEKSHQGTREDFLKECQMVLTVRLAKSEDVARIGELAARTHQLNNLLEPMDEEAIVDYLAQAHHRIYVCELADRFGYHGIVGVCLMAFEAQKAFIKLFCISCRIEGRGVGVAFLNQILDEVQAEREALNAVYCGYKPDDRNRPALMLLSMLGFKLFEKTEHRRMYVLKLPYVKEALEYIEVHAVRD